MQHPSTWQELWNKMESEGAPPSKEGKVRCSSLPKYAYCTEFTQTGSSDPATRGRALHYIMEHDLQSMPFDIPSEEEEQIHTAMRAVEMLEDEGWEVYRREGDTKDTGREMYMENERTTGNADLVMVKHSKDLHWHLDFLIIDYKFGFGHVDADSPQLAGLAELTWTVLGDEYAIDSVQTGIIQPSWIEHTNSIPIRAWTLKEAQDVVDYCAKKKITISKSCQFCDKKFDCEEATSRAKALKEEWKK